MKRMYQREWHGIPFEAVGAVSLTKLADASFYSSFYDIFFKKYGSPEELDPSWVELKVEAAGFLKQHSKFKKESTILFVGCGLGITEKVLIGEGFSNIEVTEISPEPLRWLLPYIPGHCVHIGFFPSCLPDGKLYDFIILPSVEYFFNQEELIDFLKAVKERLSSDGVCLLISWSFESTAAIQWAMGVVKELAAFVLEKVKVRKRGQFWGYLRKRNDYQSAMRAVGFVKIRDGLLAKETCWDTYWIEGSKN